MPIVSISLNDNILAEMDKLKDELGFSGRSELIRAGIRLLLADKLEKDKLEGELSCLLAVTHDEKEEGIVTSIKHEFDDIIKTHLHCKLRKNKCLELFILDGSADKIRAMTKEFQMNEGMDHVRLIVT